MRENVSEATDGGQRGFYCGSASEALRENRTTLS